MPYIYLNPSLWGSSGADLRHDWIPCRDQWYSSEFLQYKLYIALAVMWWCERKCMCVTKSAQGAGKLIFGVGVVVDGGSSKMSKWYPWPWPRKWGQSRRSRNFNWPHIRQFSTQNQNVWCSQFGNQIALSHVAGKLTLTFSGWNLQNAKTHKLAYLS